MLKKINKLSCQSETTAGRNAQMTSEYAIMISIVIAAIVSMTFYVKRGFQARLMDAWNYTNTSPLFNTTQYEPPYYYSNMSQVLDRRREKVIQRGGSVREGITRTLVQRGYVNITNVTNKQPN